MKIPLFAVLADSSVIIDTISDIGVLLNLGNQDPLAYRVERSGFDKENIAFFDRHCIEHLEKGILFYPAGKFLPGDFLFESIVQESPLLRVENIPHLCFAILTLVLQRKTVARVDLDRQVVLCVDKFGQDRKLTEPSAVGAEHLHAFRIQILLQRFSGVGTIHDHRRPVRMTG